MVSKARKCFLVLGLLFCVQVSSAQEEKVDDNQGKIEQLNARLDRLLGGGKSSDGSEDSVGYKLDYIFQEIKQIKTDLQNLKTVVTEMKTAEKMNTTNEVKVSEKGLAENETISDVDYFVVVASERTRGRASQKINSMENLEELMIVQNERETWYHVVTRKSYTIKDVGTAASQIRRSGISDAWWTTGKKLK